MVPRETYDPEDIESLLSERSFDELLAEERTFVLRHLSGREEYENMRRLLHQVRADESGPQEVLEPEESVREHVLNVFRERQHPSWRVWLNTVQTFLFPKEASAFWRPALAIATVALLVTGAVLGYQRLSGTDGQELAVIPEKNDPMAPGEQASDQRSSSDPERTERMEAAQSKDQAANITLRSPNEPPTVTLDVSTGSEQLQQAGASATEEVAENEITDKRTVDAFGSVASDSASYDLLNAPQAAGSHVAREDFERNATLTNATGEVARKEIALAETTKSRTRRAKLEEKSLDADSRSLAQDKQMLDLLNAAW